MKSLVKQFPNLSWSGWAGIFGIALVENTILKIKFPLFQSANISVILNIRVLIDISHFPRIRLGISLNIQEWGGDADDDTERPEEHA